MRRPVRTLLGAALGLLLMGAPAIAAGTVTRASDQVLQGDYNGAIGTLETYIRKFPSDPRPYYWLVKAYEGTFQVDRLTDAQQKYNALTADRAQVFRTLTGAEPVEVYRRMLADDPDDLANQVLLAIALYNGKQVDPAEAVLRRLRVGDLPTALQEATLNLTGLVFYSRLQLDEARAEFTAAERLNDDNPLPRQKLTEIKALLLQAQQDAETKQRAALPPPEDPGRKAFDLTYKLGQDLLTEGKYQGAVDALQQAVDADPTQFMARRLLDQAKRARAGELAQDGLALVKNHDLDGALDVLDAAVKLDPNNSLAVTTLAQVKADEARMKAAPKP